MIISEKLELEFDNCKQQCIKYRNEPDKIDCTISHLKRLVSIEMAGKISALEEELDSERVKYYNFLMDSI